MEKRHVCKSCHWGWALVAGLCAGLSAGLFVKSEKGAKLSTQTKKAAGHLQKELMKKWKQAEHFSKEEYDEMVKEVIGHYKRAKGLAVDEATDLQEFLLEQWKEIQKKLK